MTKESKEQFIADYVGALATIVLTRRDDLVITAAKLVPGIDWHVFIQREDKPMRLFFGVILRGVDSPMTPDQANTFLDTSLEQIPGVRKFAYPVCLMMFELQKQTGFFSWLAEPSINDGEAKLIHHKQVNCVPLTNEVVNHVVEQIVVWYDAVEAVPVA